MAAWLVKTLMNSTSDGDTDRPATLRSLGATPSIALMPLGSHRERRWAIVLAPQPR
jgi:hypothetical protein